MTVTVIFLHEWNWKVNSKKVETLDLPCLCIQVKKKIIYY